MKPAGPLAVPVIRQARADEMRAEVMVTCAGDGAGACLVGAFVGPRRGRDMTLPTTVRLVSMPGDRDAAARAVFTEPAYWTPELPNLYRLEAEVRHGDQVVAVIDRVVGLRRLGVRGRSFWLDGRRFVPRGVTTATVGFDPAPVRHAAAAAVLRDPDTDVLSAADRSGTAIVARFEDAAGRGVDHVRAAERIADWALHPSVVLAVVPHSVDDVEAGRIIAAVRPLKGTMLAGLEVDGTQPPDAVPAALVAAVDCLLLRLPGEEMPHEAWRSRQPAKPLVAGRSVACGDVAEQRRECDRLQAALAAWGLAGGADRLPWDWAGYLAAAW